MEEENSPFKYSQVEEDFVNSFQYAAHIKVPLRGKETTIHFSVLWEGDVYDITKASAHETPHPQDLMTRGPFIRMETLVEAISKIGDTEYVSDDEEQHKALKNKLRVILKKSSPPLIAHIYDMYSQLVEVRDLEIKKKLEPYIEKTMKEIQGIKPL